MSQLRYKQHAAAVQDDVFSKTKQLPIGNLGQLGFGQQGSGLICCLIFSPLVLSVLLRDVTWHRTVTVTWRLLWHGEGSQSILNYLLSGFHFIGYDLLEICWTLAEGINYVYCNLHSRWYERLPLGRRETFIPSTVLELLLAQIPSNNRWIWQKNLSTTIFGRRYTLW